MFMEYRDFFFGIKRSERDVEHLTSSSAEVNRECSRTSIGLYLTAKIMLL